MSEELKAYTFGPLSGQAPKQIVILLHGLGANGQDLLGLAPEYAQALPDTVFVSPDAPFACDMAPMGYQWFSLLDRDPDKILAGIKTASPILENFIEQQLEKYGLGADKLALVGFSQGTMMSLYFGPRYKSQIAGIMGYSGALIWDQETAIDALKKPPVNLVHGEADNVVSIEAYYNAREVLESSGFNVTGHTTPHLMHGIDGDGIDSGREFLKTVLT